MEGESILTETEAEIAKGCTSEEDLVAFITPNLTRVFND